ncbi:alpha/beta fold hydrolase [Variovorax sp. ZT5P49]|uniref:alpha/beta fold hydrolase n=1 Tax=Variovorax sp. ZT5P49 TaxID=3443733 RepID=UPI003F488C26
MTDLPFYALPGLMNDARLWQHAIAAMPGRLTRIADVVAHDSVSALAAAALVSAPAERFALAAFSLGGYVAFEMLRQAPERVVALALVDTSARPDTPESIEMRQRMIAGVAADAENFAAVAGAFLPRAVHPSRVGDATLGELLASMARSVGTEGFVRQQRAASGRPDSRPLLKDIQCPTLVLCGRQDQLTPLECSEEMAAGIPGAQLVILENCGHVAPLEQPEAVNAALLRWLERA